MKQPDTFPSFHAQGPQGLIDSLAKITESDIVIGIFWKSLGTLVNAAETGTEHEFNIAYNS